MLGGGIGNDEVNGGSQNESLCGGVGVDTIIGGTGRDVMFGGFGADLFVYANITETGTTTATRDQIMDFQAGVNRIDLSALPRQLHFIGSMNFMATGPGTGQIRFSGGSNQWIVIDSNGDDVANGRIFVGSIAGLTEDNFIL